MNHECGQAPIDVGVEEPNLDIIAGVADAHDVVDDRDIKGSQRFRVARPCRRILFGSRLHSQIRGARIPIHVTVIERMTGFEPHTPASIDE